jgi:hypothetical protein
MGAKPKMPRGGYGIPQQATGYYQPTAKSTDWLSAINTGWKAYEPQKVQTNYTPSAPTTGYDPYQQNALSTLVAQMQGTTPEGKQKIISGAMAPVYEEATKQKEAATSGAYARGLGQSGVLQRSLGGIDQSTLARMAEVTGGVEQNSITNALNAVQAFQSGQASQQQVGVAVEQMRTDNAKANAQLSQSYEELKGKMNIDDRQLQIALGQLAENAYKDDYTRSLAEQKIMQDYNIDKATLEQAKWVAEQQAAQAKKDWWSNLIANILKAGATVAGAAILAPAAAPAAAASVLV